MHLLPAPSTTTTTPPTPPLSTTLPFLAQTSDAQLARAHLLRLSTAATHRIPELRARAAAFWARERALGTALRRDPDVRAAAEKVGLGIAPPAPVPSEGTAPAQKRAAPALTGESGHEVSGSGEGALHKAARAAVATLKEAVLGSPAPSDGGAQQ
jgi:hypothetical protein